LLGLAVIVVLGLGLRGWRLGASGFITPYYMVGVRSMMVSWHNFFFNAFDPAGFVSIDKPPLAFWAQTLSAELFGFSPSSILLPQALEGLVSVLVLYHLVRRLRHCSWPPRRAVPNFDADRCRRRPLEQHRYESRIDIAACGMGLDPRG
jgi:4-amino-4-deoxy-L-arabinose transferase-like glycosyltransferase